MNQKVFIIEDEPDLRDTLKYNFENEGFNVQSFANGESFLDAVNQNKPNLIILDLMLPGMSGLDVCKQLRSNDDFDGIADARGLLLWDDCVVRARGNVNLFLSLFRYMLIQLLQYNLCVYIYVFTWMY